MIDPADFFLNQPEPNQSCLQALRSIILDYDPEMTETTKYGMPCYCRNNKALCYLWSDKKSKEPYILFVNGNLMDHPLLEKGNRSRMKIFRINPLNDLPIETIKTVLNLVMKANNLNPI